MPYDLPEIVERVYARFHHRWPLLDPQDAKQEALLICLRRADQWNGARSSAPTYFSLVARHAIQAAHDRELTHRRRHPVSSNQTNEAGNEIIADTPDPEQRDSASDAEIACAVRSVLDSLPPLVRDLIAADGDSEARAAILESAGITRQAGDKRVKRAREVFRRLLGAHL